MGQTSIQRAHIGISASISSLALKSRNARTPETSELSKSNNPGFGFELNLPIEDRWRVGFSYSGFSAKIPTINKQKVTQDSAQTHSLRIYGDHAIRPWSLSLASTTIDPFFRVGIRHFREPFLSVISPTSAKIDDLGVTSVLAGFGVNSRFNDRWSLEGVLITHLPLTAIDVEAGLNYQLSENLAIGLTATLLYQDLSPSQTNSDQQQTLSVYDIGVRLRYSFGGPG